MKTMCNKFSVFFLVLLFFYFQQNYFVVTAVLHTKSNRVRLISKRLTGYKKADNSVNHHIEPVIKNQKLNATQGKTPMWSNAFNFNKLSGTEVDPRTGILTAHFDVGNLLSNFGHGPDINLQINYNSMTIANPDGLGHGWSWNLTHFNPVTDQLTTSFGQTFYLQSEGYQLWKPLYHKLQDIKVSGDKSTHFVITYANGLRETLSHEGYITQLEQQDGRSVDFLYQQGTHLLNTIIDNMNHRISITRNQGYWVVNSYSIDGQSVTIQIDNQHSRINKVILLSDRHPTVPSIHLKYRYGYLLSSVDYPSGMKKRITYNCSNAMKFSLQSTFSVKSLCVVANESVNPGAGQPEMKVNYYYTMESNAHNYLGFNGGLSFFPGMKRDSLFEAPVNYIYHTIKDNGLTKEIRTWNKYHLLTDTRLISNHTGRLLSEVKSYFCSTDSPDACAHTSFSDLPSNYSLPLKTVTYVWGGQTGSTATNTETNTYDNYGRIISHKDGYGRITTTHYCPVKGDGVACPPTSPGWLFSQLPKKITFYPAKGSNLPAVTHYNFYRKLANFQGAGYILVLDHQTLRASEQWTTVTRDYYDTPADALSYGLLKKTTLTGNIGESSPLTSVVHNYRYVKSSDNQNETIYSTISLGGKKFQLLPTVTISLFTHQLLMRSDATGRNVTRYHYDKSGHLLQTDLAVGTMFATSVHYQYVISHQQNYIIITAANGLKSKITFDGMGRQLVHFGQAIYANGKVKPDVWQIKSKKSYDNYGRVKQQSLYTEEANGKIISLTTTKDYDEMGRTLQIHLPNGEKAITKYDDADRCMVSYLQSRSGLRSTLSVIHANILNKPILQQIFPASEVAVLANVKKLCNIDTKFRRVKTTAFFYDGFGRAIKTIDPSGKVVKRRYDAIGRVTDIINPKQDRIHQHYDLLGKVIARWALPATGKEYLLYTARYNAAGQLLWQAGEDGGKTWFTYTPAGKIATVTTSVKHKISIQYNLLGLPVAKYLNGHLLQKITYDPVTALPVSKSDATGKTILVYSIDHLPVQLVHIGKNHYPDYNLFWKYDNNRRITSQTDISGNQTLITYDHLGRNSAIYYQSHIKTNSEVLSVPVYDDFSRVVSIHYGSGMQRTITYDNWGREKKITDKTAEKLLMRWHLSYDVNSNIKTLVQQTENNQQAVLNYHYDVLNNLSSMTCTGSADLPLCPRDTTITSSGGLQNAPIITRQDYTFTPLNRLSQIREILQNVQAPGTLKKIITYGYYNLKAPLRLQQVSTKWDERSATVHYFNYDMVGNMITDGENNHITYNAFNQVTHVITAQGKQSSYAYDGSGKEVFEKDTAGDVFLFYRGRHLINKQIDSFGQATHITGYQGIAKTIDSLIYQYYENNYKGDIISILTKSPKNNNYRVSQRNIYSPYGMFWYSIPSSLPFYQRNLVGFNGKDTDPATGWQFLGNGRRTYNPAMRYFVSEDSAGDGYAFGSNNPIMNSDPTGNISKGVSKAFKILGYIGSLGMRAIPQRWAAITGTIISAGLMAASGGGLSLALPVIIMNGSCSGLSVAAASVPSNKGLNIAASVVGMIQFFSVLVGSVASPAYGWLSTSGVVTDVATVTNEAFEMNEVAAEAFSEIESVSAVSADNQVNPYLFDADVSDSSDNDSFEVTTEKSINLYHKLMESIPALINNENSLPAIQITDLDDIEKVQKSLADLYGASGVRNEISMALVASCSKRIPIFLDSLSIFLDRAVEMDLEVISNDENNILSLNQLIGSSVKSYTSVSFSVPDLCTESGESLIFEQQGALIFLAKNPNTWTRIQFRPDGSMVNVNLNSIDMILDDLIENDSQTLKVDKYYQL